MLSSRLALLAAIAISAVLAACSASPKGPDLTPSGAFDPVKDRERVVYCIGAHLAPAGFAIDTLHMDEAAVMADDERLLHPRAERLKPFALAIEKREPPSEGGLYGEAGGRSLDYTRQFSGEAMIPGRGNAVWKKLLDESAKCDALVRSWGAPPPN